MTGDGARGAALALTDVAATVRGATSGAGSPCAAWGVATGAHAESKLSAATMGAATRSPAERIGRRVLRTGDTMVQVRGRLKFLHTEESGPFAPTSGFSVL